MGDDSFRGTCLKCGGPVAGGANIHKDCAQLELQATRSFGDANKMVSTSSYGTNRATIPAPEREKETMANVQVCERCGSIGQARDFISLSAVTMMGESLIVPQLITRRAYERGIEESMEEEPSPSESSTLCRLCRIALRDFLQNKPTDSGTASPLAPRLPSGKPSGKHGA